MYFVALFILLAFIFSGCRPDYKIYSVEYGPESYEVALSENRRAATAETAAYFDAFLGFEVMMLGVVPPERLIAVNRASDLGISYIAEETKHVRTRLYSYPIESVVALKPDQVVAST